MDTEGTLKQINWNAVGKKMGYEISTCQMKYDANN